MKKRFASLSLDLDNKWSYMKTHGDEGWESYPSYFDIVVPRVLEILRERDMTITFFIVGQDAVLEKNHGALRSIADAGHEIANHSFQHEPWLHLYSDEELEREFTDAEEAIFAATGQKTVGFRGPGFSRSDAVMKLLDRRGYKYDCSTFPTYLGPVARAYYFMTANFDKEEKEERKELYGKFSEGFQTLRPYKWSSLGLDLPEIPVTTMPVFKVPIHLSYIQYLAQYSRTVALTYFWKALTLCKIFRVEPSILLHPVDFLGCEDDTDVAFFPAMKMPAKIKIDVATSVLDMIKNRFDVGPMIEHARRFNERT